jgi:hypothetical protein
MEPTYDEFKAENAALRAENAELRALVAQLLYCYLGSPA